jgi:hypothetical protein
MPRVCLLLLLLPTLGLSAAGCTACFDAFQQYTDVVEQAENLDKSGSGWSGPAPSAPSPPNASVTPPGSASPAAYSQLLVRPDRRLEARLQRNEIPQLSDRWDLFAELKDGPVDPATGGVLVCDLRLPGTPWYQSRPDMEAALTLGSQPAMYLVGEDNRDATVVTAPIVGLTTGDPIKLVVEDRDFIGRNDHLDSARGAYAGVFPLLMVGDARDLHVTCRGMAKHEVQRRLALRKQQADEALTAFDQARELDPAAPDWGYPWSLHEDAEAAIERVPALAGWRDPDVRSMLDRSAGTRADWDREARASVRQMQASATPVATRVPAPGGRVDLTVQRAVCGSGISPLFTGYGIHTDDVLPNCVVELKISAPVSPAELPPSGIDNRALIPGAGGVDLVLSDGRTEPLHVEAVVVDGAHQSPPPGRVEVGADVRMLLRLESDYGGGSPVPTAPMIRVERGATPQFLLLR